MPKNKPADPAAIAAARQERQALAREHARQSQRDPANWGPAEVNYSLPTAASIAITAGGRGRAMKTQRLDVFDHLRAAGSLDQAHHRASERYLELLQVAMGVRTDDVLRLTVVDNGGSADLVSQRMIDAGRRLAAVEARIGRRDLRLLRELVAPTMRGEAFEDIPAPANDHVPSEAPRRRAPTDWRDWKGAVLRITGESERHAQAGAVRSMLGNLGEAIDEEEKAEGLRRKAAREARDHDAEVAERQAETGRRAGEAA